jgi:hypothetical protein
VADRVHGEDDFALVPHVFLQFVQSVAVVAEALGHHSLVLQRNVNIGTFAGNFVRTSSIEVELFVRLLVPLLRLP